MCELPFFFDNINQIYQQMISYSFTYDRKRWTEEVSVGNDFSVSLFHFLHLVMRAFDFQVYEILKTSFCGNMTEVSAPIPDTQFSVLKQKS